MIITYKIQISVKKVKKAIKNVLIITTASRILIINNGKKVFQNYAKIQLLRYLLLAKKVVPLFLNLQWKIHQSLIRKLEISIIEVAQNKQKIQLIFKWIIWENVKIKNLVNFSNHRKIIMIIWKKKKK